MAELPAGPVPEHPMPAAHPIGDMTVVTLLLDMQQQIARVEGTQIGLLNQMAHADTSRREIHKKLDVVGDKATAAAHRAEIAVARAEQAVATAAVLKPSVDDYMTMKRYVRAGLWALGLVIMPLIGLLGYGAMQLWHYIVVHIDLSRLWK